MTPAPLPPAEALDLAAVWIESPSRSARGRALLAGLRRVELSVDEKAELERLFAVDAAVRRARAAEALRRSAVGAALGAVGFLLSAALFRLTFPQGPAPRFEVEELIPRVAVVLPAAPEAPAPPPAPVVAPEAPLPSPSADPSPAPDPAPPAAAPDPGPARSAGDAAARLAGGGSAGLQGVDVGNKEVMGQVEDAFAAAAAATSAEDRTLKDDGPALGDGAAQEARAKAGGGKLRSVGGSGAGATWVGETEVTQAEWAGVMGEDTSVINGQWTYPVVQVSWCEALRFANRKSKKEGLTPAYSLTSACERGGEVSWDTAADGYRLLTDGEWRRLAATGGVSRRVSMYQNNLDIVDVTADAVATPDGVKGLHDNARELVWAGPLGDGGVLLHGALSPRAAVMGCKAGRSGGDHCRAEARPAARQLEVGLRIARGPVRE
jgi:hypothetical protein